MDMYPSRITLFDDGVYRWSYDMDMWYNRYLLRQIIKILCVVLGIPTLIVAAMALRNILRHPDFLRFGIHFFHSDLLALIVVGGMWIGMIFLVLIVYAICAAVMHGTWRLCFEMDESAVTLIQSTEAKHRNSALATVAAVADIATSLSGKPSASLPTATAGLHTSAENGTTRFDAVRKARLYPDYDLIDLRGLFSMNQIYVNREDYAFVRDFILERVREKARP